ncbi:MAG: hypothetical protein JST48_08585 [Bacteroidetes bacterium]|nr:hypothetical protein [Bacteroidota bacterium]
MVGDKRQKLIGQIREYFTSQFVFPVNSKQVSNDVIKALEHPLLKDTIFSNNIVAIIDHNNFSYRYVSTGFADYFGTDTAVLMAQGPEWFISTFLPQDIE